MKRLTITILCLVVGLMSSAAAQDAEPLTVAVFDFAAKDKADESAAMVISELARVRLSMRDDLRLVTREEMEKILSEQSLGIAGVTEEAAPQVGRLLGAQVIVVGRVFSLEGEVFATAKIIGTETSRVYAEMASGDKDKIKEWSMALGDTIGNVIQKGASTLVASVRLKDAEINELRKSLGEASLPKVFVCISEEVIGVEVPDPAAQTELQRILSKLGFEVVKDTSGELKKWAEAYAAEGGKTAPPKGMSVDVFLIGEGFSQFAARTGDLVSARARVELEALDPRTGAVLASERETASAVDLAEQIAAKTALQETAARLTYRALPQIVEKWRAAHGNNATRPVSHKGTKRICAK